MFNLFNCLSLLAFISFTLFVAVLHMNFQCLKVICYIICITRFIGQNRPQFRATEPENPDKVKELVQRLEKYQTPNPDDAEYVRLELAK